MAETTHLGLQLVNSTEWATTYFKDYIEAMSGVGDASNMAKIDTAVAALQKAVENIPSPITGASAQVVAREAVSKGNVVRIEDGGAYLATTATAVSSYQLGIADEDIEVAASGSVTVVALVDSHADSIIEQNHQAAQKIWSGTHAEYTALSDKDADTLYLVTEDDTEGDTAVTAQDLASAVAASEARTNAQLEQLFQSVDDGKEAIASAITDKGVETTKDATFAEMAANIGEISTGADTSDATMTAADLRVGKTGYGASGKIDGSLADTASGSPTISFDTSTGKVTASVHQDSGYIPASTDQSATYQVTVRAAQTYTPGTSAQTITAGQYLTGTQTIQGDSSLVAGNIKSGVSIFGVTGTLESSTAGAEASVTVNNTTSSGNLLVSGSINRQACRSGDSWTAVVGHVGEKVSVTFYNGTLTVSGLSSPSAVYAMNSVKSYLYTISSADFSASLS